MKQLSREDLQNQCTNTMTCCVVFLVGSENELASPEDNLLVLFYRWLYPGSPNPHATSRSVENVSVDDGQGFYRSRTY